MYAVENIGNSWRRSTFSSCTASNGVVIFPCSLIGDMLETSIARFSAKYQYLDGSSDDLIQFLAIMTAVCHARSTSPFWCCLFGGAHSTLIFSSSNIFRDSEPMSFLSKSVRMSFGLVPTSTRNFLIARVMDVVKFFNGYILLYLVALSTNMRQYLMPPMADVGPKPISMCHTSLYCSFLVLGVVFLLLERSVAV